MGKKTKVAVAALATAAVLGAGMGIGFAVESGSNTSTPGADHTGMMPRGAGGQDHAGMMGGDDSGQDHAGIVGAMGGAGMSGASGAAGSSPMAMGMDFNDEFGYLIEMIPHHEEAIATAKIVAANTTHPELKALAENIIQTQTEQVAQMKAWLAERYPGRDTSFDYKPMMRDLTKLSGDALDRTFLEDMVPHHGWAVWSSQKLVGQDLAEHQDVVPFATNIRDSQASQIHTMLGMLSRWFDESAMDVMARHMART
jgi:uncharacterized protein (DUF305 family)